MIIAKISGGLGNQMFQYANAFAISKKLGVELKLDLLYFKKNANWVQRIYELGNIFNISQKEIHKKELPRFLHSSSYKLMHIGKLLFKKIYSKFSKFYYLEPSLHFDKNISFVQDGCYIDGYFQSEEYFSGYKQEIYTLFTFQKLLNTISVELKEKIQSSSSVFLHIRRGDYVASKITSLTHGFCGLEYYYDALKIIKEKVSNPTFFIFSDDSKWVKENLIIENAIYVDHNRKEDNRQDMALMSYCKHGIIANSSYSWWGAWLITNNDKIIIGPKKWNNIDKDLKILPNGRIKI